VAERERALLPRVDLRPADRCVEVGCGEGANLYQWAAGSAGAGRAWVGVDLFFAKVRHAARQIPGVRAVCAKGQQLPFPDATFHHVLSRDIFHHVLDKDALMMELRRVCAAGGTITLIEPNGRNPIIWLFALVHRAERDLMAMRPEVLRRLAGAAAADLRFEFFDPFPVYRVVFHYRYGLPGLARFPQCRRAVSALERWVGRILPRERWGYMRATLHVH
jgi:SAM-dependent methyltransferase